MDDNVQDDTAFFYLVLQERGAVKGVFADQETAQARAEMLAKEHWQAQTMVFVCTVPQNSIVDRPLILGHYRAKSHGGVEYIPHEGATR